MFFLDLDKSLKRNHKYFYQIQFQLFVCDFQKCDFIVWTPNWLHILEIERGAIFVANKLLVVENFYMKNILPELLTRKLENFEKKKFDGKKEKHYCYCKSILMKMKHGSVVTLRHVNGSGFILHALTLNESPKVTGVVQYIEIKKRKSYNKENEICKKKRVTQANS